MDAQLLNLDSDIQSLYKLCAEWNLSQDEINRGISGVFGSLGSRPDHAPSESETDSTAGGSQEGSQARGPLRKAARCMWKAFKVLVAVIIIYIVVSTFVSYYPPADRFIAKHLNRLNYPIIRTVRLLALPFAHSLQFSGLYTKECLVENPWFVYPEVDCQECHYVTKVKSFQNLNEDMFEEEFYNRGQPILIRKAMEFNVTLEDLREVYREGDNADKLENGILHFESNSEQVTSLSALLGTASVAEIQEQKQIHIEWSGRGVAAARVLRQLFPRPYFVPKEAEVSLEKTVMVDGPVSKTYTLSKGSFSNTWYVQGSGSRRLILLPKGDCISKCKPVQVVVRAGEIVNFNDMVWQVDSVPSIEPGEEPEMSVAFCGTYF